MVCRWERGTRSTNVQKGGKLSNYGVNVLYGLYSMSDFPCLCGIFITVPVRGRVQVVRWSRVCRCDFDRTVIGVEILGYIVGEILMVIGEKEVYCRWSAFS